MLRKKKKATAFKGQTDANITPLADVTTTLIVVFLITMPAMMWNGIQVNATSASANSEIVTAAAPEEDEEMLTVVVSVGEVTVNGVVVELGALEKELRERLALRIDKTVVVVPSDAVPLGDVVAVLDAAKAGGAQSLAMLNRKEG
jgi:biopolymer transport protein ExbD